MSNKELVLEILDKIPDHKMPFVLSFLQGFQLDDEIEDDLYCERLVDDYLSSYGTENHETVSFSQAKKQLGAD